jgi:hypothetical protein
MVQPTRKAYMVHGASGSKSISGHSGFQAGMRPGAESWEAESWEAESWEEGHPAIRCTQSPVGRRLVCLSPADIIEPPVPEAEIPKTFCTAPGQIGYGRKISERSVRWQVTNTFM